MHVSRIARTSLAAALLLGCRDGSLAPPAGFEHALATRACGPTDGPSVMIYLTSEPMESLQPRAPYVVLAVHRALDDLPGQSWSVGRDGSEAFATFHPTASSFELATAGTIKVTTVSSETSVEGTVDVTFPEAGPIRGGFVAQWYVRTILCG